MEHSPIAVSSDSSCSDIDYEGIPATEVGVKKTLKVFTYQELHIYITELVKVLEEVYELGVMKGTIQKFSEAQKTGPEHDKDQECPS